jgi:predicted secreted protein
MRMMKDAVMQDIRFCQGLAEPQMFASFAKRGMDDHAQVKYLVGACHRVRI